MLIESADVPDGTPAQTGAVRLSDRVRLAMPLVVGAEGEGNLLILVRACVACIE